MLIIKSSNVSKVTQSVLRLYWRVTYRHMTRITTNSLNRWYITHQLPQVICKDLVRIFMSKILTYQLGRRNFYLSRKFTPYKTDLPNKAAKEVAPIGKLNLHTGKLTICKKLISIFKSFDCWTDFNLKTNTALPLSSESPSS